jgi:phage terminase large subunit GpA-like protein
MLSKGDRHLLGDLYGKPNRIKEDDGGRPLPVPVIERIVNVSAVKRVMARRLDIPKPGPGFIHLPRDIEDRYGASSSRDDVNGEWIRRGRERNVGHAHHVRGRARAAGAGKRAIDWATTRRRLQCRSFHRKSER